MKNKREIKCISEGLNMMKSKKKKVTRQKENIYDQDIIAVKLEVHMPI